MSGRSGVTRSLRKEDGFTYLAALFMVVVIGISIAITAEVWSNVVKREREEELLFRGAEMRDAIKSYYYSSPGARVFPRELNQLIKDPRFPGVRRHLRKIYDDPMTGKPDWEAIKAPDGAIKGVRSLSGAEPLKKENFPSGFEDFIGKSKYSEWEFVYDPQKDEAVSKKKQTWKK